MVCNARLAGTLSVVRILIKEDIIVKVEGIQEITTQINNL